MINATQLLKDLQRLLKELEDDLRERVGAVAKERNCTTKARRARRKSTKYIFVSFVPSW